MLALALFLAKDRMKMSWLGNVDGWVRALKRTLSRTTYQRSPGPLEPPVSVSVLAEPDVWAVLPLERRREALTGPLAEPLALQIGATLETLQPVPPLAEPSEVLLALQSEPSHEDEASLARPTRIWSRTTNLDKTRLSSETELLED